VTAERNYPHDLEKNLINYMRGFVPADEVLSFRQKYQKPFLPVRGPAGPSASAPNQDGCATRSAQTVLAEKSIRGCGSAAPNAGTQNS